MKPATWRWTIVGLLALGGGGIAAVSCSPGGHAVDLVRAAEGGGLTEGTVAGGRSGRWLANQIGKTLRLNDVVRRTLPAAPPSRLRYTLDIPKGAHLRFACGIPADHHDRPGVEFVVKVRKGGREETVWTLLVDPVSHPQHRLWVPVDVDLSRYAGRGVDLVLETRGYAGAEEDPRGAFWGTPAVTVPRSEAPLVIVYLVDTLRADHTSPYGYSRDTTPRLAAFAKDAVVFDTAVAQASWTKPSVASMMTSLLPGKHRAVQLRDALDLGHVTMAEMLAAKGYSTGAAIANSVIYSEGVHFDQGFDAFTGLHGAGDRPSKIVEAGPVVDAGLAWLDARAGLPTFLYVHTMDPHVPYTPPPPFDRKYEPFATPDHPAVDPRTDYKEPLDRDRMIARYDGEIAYGDQEFGRFIDGLKQRGLYDRALIVFMGDHGEEFQDHGKWLHGRSVFDELIHIPLIVKFPGSRHGGTRVKQQVQEVDILPTILDELGLPVPKPPDIAGRPLQVVLQGGAPEPPAVSEISHRGFVAHGMRTSRDKYIRRFSPEEDELYFDLTRDPKEQVNRIDANMERARQLRGGVEAVMAPNPYRHTLKVLGSGVYELRLRTGGWLEGVEAVGLGAGERYDLEANGRRLVLALRPRPGSPREVAFGVRPMGAPVFLEGTRDGHPLEASEVFIAQDADHPPAVPFQLPEIEPTGDKDEAPNTNMLAPPKIERPGLQVWLHLIPGRKVMELDKEARERLKALGYLGN
jgi:arylsulfatase A-like enzyme